LDTLIVPGVRILADAPESIRVTCAWIGECLSGSPVADDAALMVSRLAASAILYSTSGQPGDPVTASVAIGRGMARIHVISQGARCRYGRTRSAAAAATPAAAGLTIICALSEQFAAEGPDKCLTFHIAGSARTFLPGGPGDDHWLPDGGPVGSWPLMISKITLAGWTAYAAWLAEEVSDTRAALDGLASLEAEAAIPAGQVFGPDGWGDAATWSAEAARPEAEQ
jgi:hypothetical protein